MRGGRFLAEGLRNIEFYCGSIEDQAVSQPCDVVICSEVLEHLQEPDIFIGKIKGHLRDEGLLLVTVPNGFGYFELDNYFWQLISRSPWVVDKLYRLVAAFWSISGSAAKLKRMREEYQPKRYELTISTFAPDTSHYQSFTCSKILQLLGIQGLRILAVRNNTFLAGNILSLFLRELDGLIAWNARVADRLPGFLVSGWLIAVEKGTK